MINSRTDTQQCSTFLSVDQQELTRLWRGKLLPSHSSAISAALHKVFSKGEFFKKFDFEVPLQHKILGSGGGRHGNSSTKYFAHSFLPYFCSHPCPSAKWGHYSTAGQLLKDLETIQWAAAITGKRMTRLKLCGSQAGVPSGRHNSQIWKIRSKSQSGLSQVEILVENKDKMKDCQRL